MRRALWLFDRGCECVACLALVALLVTVALGVVTRAADDPLVWSDELSRILMVWLAALGWIIGARRRAHVRIRYFHDRLPAGPRRMVEAVIQLAMALLGALVFWFGFGLVARNAGLEALTLPMSMGWLYAPLIPVGLVTTLQAVAECVAALAGRGGVAP